MMLRFIFLLVVLSSGMQAQTLDTLSVERYEMADRLRWRTIMKQVYHLNVNPKWKSDHTGMWFQEQSKIGTRYKHIDFEEIKVKEIFDHDLLAKKLNNQFDLKVDPKNLGLADLIFKSKDEVGFKLNNKNYNYNLDTKHLQIKKDDEAINPLESTSPNGKWIAFVRDYNLFVKSAEGNEEVQLSCTGEKNYEYASRYGWFDKMEGEGGERPERFSVSWSPDSKKIYCNIVDLRSASKMYMLDNSIDSLYRPKLLSYYRASPGDENIIYYHPVVFDVENITETKIDIDPVPHFMGIYPTWVNEGERLFLTHWKRGFREAGISQVDLLNGDLSTIYSEQSNIGIEYSAFVPYYSQENDAFIFTSEKSGWKQLYKLDIESKQVASLTSGKYFVDEVEHIDEENAITYFTAAGKDPEANPYHNYLYRVNFDGSNLQLLTKAPGHHEVQIAPDGKYFVDNHSTFAQATVSTLCNLINGNEEVKISTANVEYLDSVGWQTPMPFKVKADDGLTNIHGVIYKPTDFDSTQSYPILDASYTGPHTSRFPKSYYSTIRSNAPAMAELGFVLIRVDGRGSNHRSKGFRSYSYKNLGGGLDDHVTAIKTLAKQYSWIDTTRVGIFGHSAGGYDVGRALLAYGDFYKVGVASSADHDHRMEKAWWPEMYMGWPVDEAYHEQSNITNAKNLKGKLLLVHGALDDNVNISATMKLSEALIKANKEFDLLIFPSQRHGYQGDYTDYFAKKRWNYFVEHLLGKVPRWDW